MDLPPGDDPMTAPSGFAPQPLGARVDLVAAIQHVQPRADFSDPTWGSLETEEYVIEFSMGKHDPVESITLHVHGGDAVVDVIAGLLTHLGQRAVDLQTDALFDPVGSRESLVGWQTFRDRVVHGPDPSATG